MELTTSNEQDGDTETENWAIVLKLWMAETVLSLNVNLTRNLRDYFVF